MYINVTVSLTNPENKSEEKQVLKFKGHAKINKVTRLKRFDKKLKYIAWQKMPSYFQLT